MANIFSSIREYAGKWAVKGSRKFSEEEKNQVVSNEIVESQYGNSVCFHMKSGGKTFIPLSTESSLGIGDSVDMDSARLVTLGKSGEADIVRVDA